MQNTNTIALSSQWETINITFPVPIKCPIHSSTFVRVSIWIIKQKRMGGIEVAPGIVQLLLHKVCLNQSKRIINAPHRLQMPSHWQQCLFQNLLELNRLVFLFQNQKILQQLWTTSLYSLE